jgi:hypothetical protein
MKNANNHDKNLPCSSLLLAVMIPFPHWAIRPPSLLLVFPTLNIVSTGSISVNEFGEIIVLDPVMMHLSTNRAYPKQLPSSEL